MGERDLLYNPDASGPRAPVEDAKSLDTVDELTTKVRRRQSAIYLEVVRRVEQLILTEEEVHGDEDRARGSGPCSASASGAGR